MTGISLFCGLWDREQNLDREIALVAVCCGYCVQFQEVAASEEEEGRLTLACDWSIVIIEASDWSEVWVAPGSLIIQVIVVGSRPQRERAPDGG